MRYFIVFFILLSGIADFTSADIAVHTYSIVARDPETGEMGVAVQSEAFMSGAIVPWAEAGVGVVATQALPDVAYGPLGLELMKGGKPAPDALRALLAADEQREVRQVAMIDANGRTGAHTGKQCIAAAGHFQGDQYSVQANLMANDSVWPAMAQAFESTKGSLAERMMAALDAAEAAGGDIRGRRSAAMVIVSGTRTGDFWQDRLLDLRVDDHPSPLEELRRLMKVHRAFQHAIRADELISKNDLAGAEKEFEIAAALTPEDHELFFLYAVSLYNAGDEQKALQLFRDVFRKDRRWLEVAERLPAAGLLPEDAIAKIKEVTQK